MSPYWLEAEVQKADYRAKVVEPVDSKDFENATWKRLRGSSGSLLFRGGSLLPVLIDAQPPDLRFQCLGVVSRVSRPLQRVRISAHGSRRGQLRSFSLHDLPVPKDLRAAMSLPIRVLASFSSTTKVSVSLRMTARSGMERVNYAAGDLGMYPRHEGHWVGPMTALSHGGALTRRTIELSGSQM